MPKELLSACVVQMFRAVFEWKGLARLEGACVFYGRVGANQENGRG